MNALEKVAHRARFKDFFVLGTHRYLGRFGRAKLRHLRKCHRALIFNMLILVDPVKMADRVVREMMGL